MAVAERPKRYLKWLRRTIGVCQKTGRAHGDPPAPELEEMHPPRGRPWGGGMGQKASDHGCLIGIHDVNMAETEDRNSVWGTHRFLPERDLVAIGNLRRYAEYLDPGVDLWWDMVEYARRRVIELEAESG